MSLRLKKVLDNRGGSPKEYAKMLGVSEKTFYNKVTGVSEFTYGEIKRLKTLLPEYNIDYLLDEDTSSYSA
jgi:hypothetical protein